MRNNKLTIDVMPCGAHEIRIAAPPFSTDNTVDIQTDGRIYIDLFDDGIIDAIVELGEPDFDNEDDWFDSIQWSISLIDLVSTLLESHRAQGRYRLRLEDREDIYGLAQQLEIAAGMLRTAAAEALIYEDET